MPTSTKAKLAYQKEYNARPDEIKRRSQRNKARRAYEAKNGDLPSTVDVDHKRMVKDGGSNDGKNLRAVHQSKNRAWRQGKKGYD
jgi:hypothetical protein